MVVILFLMRNLGNPSIDDVGLALNTVIVTFAITESKDMKYSIDKQEKYAILKLEEENLNSLVAPVLKSELVIFSNEGIRNLILDLSDVKFVDSSGLSAVLTANRLWSDDKSFILTGLGHPSVKRLFEISRLDTVLKIIPTVDESVDFVFMEEIERELNNQSDSEIEFE